MAGAVVELKASGPPRYANADEKGHFVFDGLPAGTYTVSAFSPAFPAETRVLASPWELPLEKRACAVQVLVAPQDEKQ